MPSEILLILCQHIEHLVHTLRVINELHCRSVCGGEECSGCGSCFGRFGRGGRRGKGGVYLGDEVGVPGYEVAGKGVGEGGEHAAR